MKRPNGRWLLATAALFCGAVAQHVAVANAGSYQVYACSDAPDDSNHSWTASDTDATHLEEGVVCPPSYANPESEETTGVFAADVLNAPGETSDGAAALWTFAAPPGTTVVGLSYERYIGKGGGNEWDVGLKADGVTVPGETCTIPLTATECEVGGPGVRQTLSLDAATLSIGVTCDSGASQCVGGSTLQNAWATIYGATVTILDDVQPTAVSASGSLVTPSAAYRSGTDTVTVAATDGVGIMQTTVYVDGQQVSAMLRPCDYTYVIPCSNEPGATHTINWPSLNIADGSHVVQVGATDPAGNEARTMPVTVLVDTHAPTAPTGLTATESATPGTYTLTWTDPDQGAGSPIASATYSICPSTGGACITGTGSGSPPNTATVTLPSTGTWTASVYLTDQAGNVGSASPATTTVTYVPVMISKPPPPPAPKRASPKLRISSARVTAHVLTVKGTIVPAGVVDLSYKAKLHGQPRTIYASGKAKKGHFTIRLRISKHDTLVGTARAVAVFPGSRAYRRQQVTHDVKLPPKKTRRARS